MYQTMSWNYYDFPARFMEGWPWESCYFHFPRGIRLANEKIPNPIEFFTIPIERYTVEMGPALPDVFNKSGLILSDRLYRTILEFGVDNLEAFPGVLNDAETKERFTGYWAINVVGLIAAADWNKSIAAVQPGGPVIDVAFDRLVIDDTKARGALMFRLAENTTSVWLHQSLVEHIKKVGFPGVQFSKPTQVFA